MGTMEDFGCLTNLAKGGTMCKGPEAGAKLKCAKDIRKTSVTRLRKKWIVTRAVTW